MYRFFVFIPAEKDIRFTNYYNYKVFLRMQNKQFWVCFAGECDFEEDICGWSNRGDLEWVFGNIETGEADPFTSTYLMFVTPRDNMEGATAVLTSPILEPDLNCVKFWYEFVLFTIRPLSKAF